VVATRYDAEDTSGNGSVGKLSFVCRETKSFPPDPESHFTV